MTDYSKILQDVQSKLEKSLGHLEFSYNKILKLTDDVSQMDDETMETWESFAARFGRTADIFITRYIRTVILASDPGYEGSVRDYLNKAEKIGLINEAVVWLKIRELRNVAVHDYNSKNLTLIYQQLKELCPLLLNLKNVIVKDWIKN